MRMVRIDIWLSRLQDLSSSVLSVSKQSSFTSPLMHFCILMQYRALHKFLPLSGFGVRFLIYNLLLDLKVHSINYYS